MKRGVEDKVYPCKVGKEEVINEMFISRNKYATRVLMISLFTSFDITAKDHLIRFYFYFRL